MSFSGKAHALCRVCAIPFESCTMIRLFNERNEPLPIAEAFWRVSEIEIQVEDSRFPQSCCIRCRDRLQEVEDLRALCLESDRKLRKMIGLGLNEEEEGEDLGMGTVDVVPKIEIHEASGSYSWWDDTANRHESDEEENGTEELPKVKQSRKSKNIASENKDGATPKEKPSRDPKTFQCTLCGKIYKSSKNLKEHETSHFPDRMNHKCHICSQEFARRNYYLVHLKMHQTENQFKCNECDKTFSLDKLLQEHIRIKHRGERPFQCKLCPKTYPRASTLFMHVKTVHEKIRKKLYRCEKCTMSFVNKTAYDRHMNGRHRGIKLHQCPHCGTDYEFKAYVQQHIAERHPEMVENLSTCQYCGMGYSTDGYYRKHIIKKHPEHLEVFDQWVKAKRDALLGGTQPATTPIPNVVLTPREVLDLFRMSLGNVLLESEACSSSLELNLCSGSLQQEYDSEYSNTSTFGKISTLSSSFLSSPIILRNFRSDS
ncbi:conserved hypothetical protein [Culex quinquefasciatus]|uniref:Uncharacterized protein n=1 Tax=Culex quinquefasciatus TaxID=7176 RepID=B0X6F8_CULQU|nr:conserved hypothetical protein [Culex quinquefasciatus]|eukprot:XP_001865230.1 conserved hypothetical protein [Culex quinquefasciatus]